MNARGGWLLGSALGLAVVLSVARGNAQDPCPGAVWSDETEGSRVFRGKSLRYSATEYVKNLPSTKRWALWDAVAAATGRWNWASCNSGDDYPAAIAASIYSYYSPGLKGSPGNEVLDVKIDYYDQDYHSCATYNHIYNWLILYRSRGGVLCEVGKLFALLDSGQTALAHITTDVVALIAHEMGHSYGLKESGDRDCIMGGQNSSPGSYQGAHWHKAENEVADSECRDLDQISNPAQEVLAECNENPEKCISSGDPPPGSELDPGGSWEPWEVPPDPDDPDPWWTPNIEQLGEVFVTEGVVYCSAWPYPPYYFCYVCAYFVPGKGCI